ncbi:MAG: carboxylating nicotinate-nucleotide diphosphorylase [Calditrichaeota bacterium]|nr:carboxylating nicotinate-nucleotide diphosphorylase [Calditrichota bacterium]
MVGLDLKISISDIRSAACPLIDMALKEDLGDRGDVTTNAISAKNLPAAAQIVAKMDGVIAGLPVVTETFKTLDPKIKFEQIYQDGQSVQKGDVLLRLKGPAAQILMGERTALNFLGRLSGIATLTHQFVQAVRGTKCQILDTRKTTPGWRIPEKYAVSCGGGKNHRIGLYDMFLIKENHIVSAGGIPAAVNMCREYMKRNNFSAEIEVETKNPAEVKEALGLNVDRIMLDNMSLEKMCECVSIVDGRIPLEASGNVGLQNVRQIAETGVDFISIGSLTHSAKSFDVSLLFL